MLQSFAMGKPTLKSDNKTHGGLQTDVKQLVESFPATATRFIDGGCCASRNCKLRLTRLDNVETRKTHPFRRAAF